MAKKKEKIKEELRMKINGYQMGVVTHKEALKNILFELNFQIEWMNVENIKIWLLNAIDLIKEVLTWKKDSKMFQRLDGYEKYINKIDKHEELVKFVNDTILAMEGLGTLRNFNISVNGNILTLNTEKHAMRDLKR